ncbi:MAG: MerR family transcriptional regulator [Gammaproteobacteria bacterium]
MKIEHHASDDEPRAERSGLYPIGTVASLTGVNPVTLRAWERRHGLFDPVRTESGRRLYRHDDIVLIGRVVGLLERGMRIGQVKAELEAIQSDEAERAADGVEPWTTLRERMTAAIIRFDEDALETNYNEALSLYPIDVVTRELMTPLLVALGERWKSGTGSVAEEHFFGVYLRNKLGARFHHRPRQLHGERLLVACLPDEQHENGLLLLSLALHERGYSPVLLGANMPLEEIPFAARQARCVAVVLSGSIKPSPEVLSEKLPRVVAECDTPLIVGGMSSVRCHKEIAEAGAHPVGDDLEQGIRKIDVLLKRKRGPAEKVNQRNPSQRKR